MGSADSSRTPLISEGRFSGRILNSAHPFNGYIDEVIIWNRALPLEAISLVYDGARVHFIGSTSDSDGWVTTYEWSSSLDGFLSNQSSFSYDSLLLTVGNHTITFRAQDNFGNHYNIRANTPQLRCAPWQKVIHREH